ncbi:MAG: phosphate-starvation-inducible PsiE family protein [Magnetococcales bacterium]|nr:phosphate-starvation-inducible PsiE family protein [Magnetococcales bacterium]
MPNGAEKGFLWKKFNTLKIFEKMICLVFQVILLFIILGLLVGTAKLVLQLGNVILDGHLASHFLHLISDVLTLFVLIELSRSLVDYFSTNRLRLTFIVDAGIVFVLREIMIKLFEHKITNEQIYALGTLLLILGVLRTSAVVVFQREKQMTEASGTKAKVENQCPVLKEA